ncbi:hypothetical protein ACFSTI_19615 [Rhizorhabdus histidinilytica]
MTKSSPAPGKPGPIPSFGGRQIPGSKPVPGAPGMPRSIIGGVRARERPNALPVPADRRVSAFSPLPVMERWAPMLPASARPRWNRATMSSPCSTSSARTGGPAAV